MRLRTAYGLMRGVLFGLVLVFGVVCLLVFLVRILGRPFPISTSQIEPDRDTGPDPLSSPILRSRPAGEGVVPQTQHF